MSVVDLTEPAAPSLVDEPRSLDKGLSPQDKAFHQIARMVGISVLVIFSAIGVFLGYQSIPTFRHYGLAFLTESDWQPQLDQIGISAVLLGTVEVALVAIIVAFPLALLTALFISEYTPNRLKSTFVSMIDLMAAIPSIVYGLWGFYLLQPAATNLARWLAQYLGFIPFFKVNTDPNAAVWQQTSFTASAFIAGLAVAMMTLPLACAVMRGVFAQAPLGEREAALALGATKWGMIRSVVLPFGRGGIIGGSMLGLGRALGETIAVLLIISPAFELKIRILEVGTITTSSLIAGLFGDATSAQLSALLTAGFILFLLTLAVNTVAAIFVGRSRSGAVTDA
ncbi:MAG: phosphate ABC transporter permease subunit PstC [Actinomycetes bacterium]